MSPTIVLMKYVNNTPNLHYYVHFTNLITGRLVLNIIVTVVITVPTVNRYNGTNFTTSK